MDTPDIWCVIAFTLLPDLIILQETSYRKCLGQLQMNLLSYISPLNPSAPTNRFWHGQLATHRGP